MSTPEVSAATVEEAAGTGEAAVEESEAAVEESEAAVEESAGTAEATVEETAGTAEATVEETAAVVEETAGTAEATVEEMDIGLGVTVEESAETAEPAVQATAGTAGASVGSTTIGDSVALWETAGAAGTTREVTADTDTPPLVGPGEATEPARAGIVAPAATTSSTAPGKAGTEGSPATLPSARQRGSLAMLGAPSGYIPVVVEKTNDANGDGSFSDSEVAPLPSGSVPFRVTITNLGAQEVVVTGARDVFSNSSGYSERVVCADLLGSSIGSGETMTCEFTIEDYAPAPGDRMVNTFELALMDPADYSNTLTVTDTSIVRTATEGVLGLSVGPGPRALAETGAAIAFLLGVMLLFAGTGGSFLQVDRWKLGGFWPSPGPAVNRIPQA